ncbi:MAG: GNAT family N-acetyltransferase, partial [Christensenella sp.]|uniref:GNAT family N-acetyltransferase n=1 Tax=Christensenella sp. TaxID=1935934 RepID=UPI002B21DF1C
MNIWPLDVSREQEAKRIWNVCFDDTDTFITQYFESFVQYEKTLGYYENDKILADLFMLPFCGKLQGKRYDADFLAGCATLPEARKRGLMRELVRAAMLDMRKRGQAVTYLHPFLHSFYRQFGYETIAYIRRETLEPKGREDQSVRIYADFSDALIRQLFDAYNGYIGQFDNAFVRTEERFAGWLRLLFADDGRCAVLEDTNGSAYALYYIDGDTA